MLFNFNYTGLLVIIIFIFGVQDSLSKETNYASEVADYFDKIHTLTTKFIQISSTGKVETGQLSLKKPDKVRFDYDFPLNHLVIASGALLVIIDRKSNSEPQRYLTSQTPLELLLSTDTTFKNSAYMKDSVLKKEKFHVVLRDSKSPNLGQVEFIFSTTPIKLIELQTTTSSGERTRVLLEDMVINPTLKDALFNIGAEISNYKNSLR